MSDAPPPYTPSTYPPPAGGAPYYPVYPQGPGYPPAPAQVVYPPAPTAISSQPATVIVHTQQVLGADACRCYCPNCQQEIVTNVTYESGLLTWLLVLAICFFGGIFGCCLIPLCCDVGKDAIHSCPACHTFLGTCKRL